MRTASIHFRQGRPIGIIIGSLDHGAPDAQKLLLLVQALSGVGLIILNGYTESPRNRSRDFPRNYHDIVAA